MLWHVRECLLPSPPVAGTQRSQTWSLMLHHSNSHNRSTRGAPSSRNRKKSARPAECGRSRWPAPAVDRRCAHSLAEISSRAHFAVVVRCQRVSRRPTIRDGSSPNCCLSAAGVSPAIETTISSSGHARSTLTLAMIRDKNAPHTRLFAGSRGARLNPVPSDTICHGPARRDAMSRSDRRNLTEGCDSNERPPGPPSSRIPAPAAMSRILAGIQYRRRLSTQSATCCCIPSPIPPTACF